jgi:cytochrome c oxidase cbb3-type subunit 3
VRVWIGVCFALLLLPTLVYEGRRDAHLLSTDADTIAMHPDLMRYAVRAGARDFGAHCAQCHGSDGIGDPARGVPNLTDDDWLYGLGEVSDIERVITYGIRSGNPKAWNLARMPAYGTLHPSSMIKNIPPLEPGQIRDVVEYLYYLQGRSRDKDAVVRGAAVYSNGGGCFDCHSADGRGDSAIGAPNLIDNINLYGDGSREALADSISNGRQGVCPGWIGKISPAAIRITALYVYSLAHAPAGAAN